MATIGALLLAAGLQFGGLRLPSLGGPDEPYRILAAFNQWQAISVSGAGPAKTALALTATRAQ